LSSFAAYIDTTNPPIELTKRPEQLSVKEFVALSNSIHQNKVSLDE
jgi:16S rRNA A1518/A1519 N6-dimethyltransferase RsmA/KsgA/DIM1 with predicted DNA glycosylase/AP lyase activity